MTITRLMIGGLAATLGFGALTVVPAHAGDTVYMRMTSPSIEPYEPYRSIYVPQEPPRVAQPFPYETVIVPVAPPRGRIIVNQPGYPDPGYGETGYYVRHVPVPPAAVEDPYDEGCQNIARQTPSGRIITVGNTCD